MLKVEQFKTARNVTWGRFLKGDYGYQAHLENIQTGEKKMRSKQDCEYLHFSFSLKRFFSE